MSDTDRKWELNTGEQPAPDGTMVLVEEIRGRLIFRPKRVEHINWKDETSFGVYKYLIWAPANEGEEVSDE